jgi:hypothetical protein
LDLLLELEAEEIWLGIEATVGSRAITALTGPSFSLRLGVARDVD